MEKHIDNKQILLAYISCVRDQEIDKPLGEMDTDLVDACSHLLLELQGKKVVLSTEQIENFVSQIPFTFTEKITPVNKKGNVRKLKNKKLLLIAAIITVLITLLSIVSIAFEWNIFDSLKDKFGSLLNTPIGVELTENGITFENFGEIKKYTNMEDLFENEKPDILLPINLPDGKNIKMIKAYKVNETEEIAVLLNDDLSYIAVKNGNIPENILNSQPIVINNLECYIENLEDVGLVQIHFKHNNYYYYFTGNDKQVLLELIKNLEEIK